MCERVAFAPRLALLITLLCLGVLVSCAPAATFTIDPSKSSLVVQISRDGVAARLGHDHVVRATTFSGRVSYDPAAPEASSISVEVQTATLKADEPATRRRFGLSGEPTATDVADIEKNMRSESQLYVTKFPVTTFMSSRIIPQTQDRYLVMGRLTIRGVTNTVRFPASVRMEGHVFRATATLKFLQSSFGYKPYSALLGAIKNRDEVMLHIDLATMPE